MRGTEKAIERRWLKAAEAAFDPVSGPAADIRMSFSNGWTVLVKIADEYRSYVAAVKTADFGREQPNLLASDAYADDVAALIAAVALWPNGWSDQ